MRTKLGGKRGAGLFVEEIGTGEGLRAEHVECKVPWALIAVLRGMETEKEGALLVRARELACCLGPC